RAKRNIERAIGQEQGRPLQTVLSVERDLAILALHGRSDLHRPAKLFRARRDIERMQPKDVTAHRSRDLFGLRDDIQGVGCRVDNRCPGDAYLVVQRYSPASLVGNGNGCYTGSGKEVRLPKR